MATENNSSATPKIVDRGYCEELVNDYFSLRIDDSYSSNEDFPVYEGVIRINDILSVLKDEYEKLRPIVAEPFNLETDEEYREWFMDMLVRIFGVSGDAEFGCEIELAYDEGEYIPRAFIYHDFGLTLSIADPIDEMLTEYRSDKKIPLQEIEELIEKVRPIMEAINDTLSCLMEYNAYPFIEDYILSHASHFLFGTSEKVLDLNNL